MWERRVQGSKLRWMELIRCLVKMRFFGSKTKCSLLLGAWCSAAAAAVGGAGLNAVVKVHEVESWIWPPPSQEPRWSIRGSFGDTVGGSKGVYLKTKNTFEYIFSGSGSCFRPGEEEPAPGFYWVSLLSCLHPRWATAELGPRSASSEGWMFASHPSGKRGSSSSQHWDKAGF